ncbi:MAG: hypothetical protein FD166_947 [Bacteroidetes bacterium]|nr:MAG: hypothetical protein FD166_947 [Bacteroidota bacterium]
MRNLLILITLLISTGISADNIDTLRVQSKITNVTVFFSGAQITRQADLKLKKGKYLIIAENLPQEINPRSIQVNGIEGCKTLSVKHQPEPQKVNIKGKDESAIEAGIKVLELKIKELKNRMNVFDMEEKIILDNSKLQKNEAGSSVTEIREAADFYRLRLNEIRQGKLSLDLELEKANIAIQESYLQLNKLISEKRKSYTQILIAIDSEKETNASLIFTYNISSAGWEPLYDFRVDNITQPLVIDYNAKVFQSSGEDWKNVKITLSTSNPSLSGEVPGLDTWYLGRKYTVPTYNTDKSGVCTLRGKVIDRNTKEPIPFVNVIVEKSGQQTGGTTSDFDGNYTIKPMQPGSYEMKASFVGYKPVLITGLVMKAGQITFQNIEMEATMVEIESFEVVDYKVPLIDKDKTSVGATISSEEIRRMPNRSANATATQVGGVYNASDMDNRNIYRNSGLQKEQNKTGTLTTNYLANSLKETVTNLEYLIDLPYSIPSDGEDYSIKIKDVSLPVNYVYHAIPKLEKDVFLTAEIRDWAQLNLLSGKSSIYYQSTFTGESAIDTDHSGDTLSISLGRDNNILVNREGNKALFDKRVMGNYIKEVIGWDITIKNNKNTTIKITVEDQFPISERKSIEVERLGAEGAKVNGDTGRITWEIELQPNEKKVLTYSYSVKYPKFENLLLE